MKKQTTELQKKEHKEECKAILKESLDQIVHLKKV